MSMNRLVWVIAGFGLAVTPATPAADGPAELKVFTTRAIATVLDSIGPEFERATGYHLAVTTDLAPRMVRWVQNGEPFDVLVAAPEHIDSLIEDGKIIPETRTDLAHSGIGIEVRAGAPHPDVSSVEAFRRALLAARSVAYLKEGRSGVYLAGLLERLGLTEAIRAKLTRPETDIVSELVAKGEVELGMVVITQILTTPGVSLVGPLPAEVQSYVTFTAGVSRNAHAPDAARRLVEFLTGPDAVAVIRAQGMEPGASTPRRSSPSRSFQ